MSQIVDCNDKDLEKLSLYARHLWPLLREKLDEEDDIDLSNVALSHYRLSILRQQDLVMEPEGEYEYKLHPGNDLASAKAKDKEEELLSQILARLNELFITDGLTDKDLIQRAKRYPEYPANGLLQAVMQRVGQCHDDARPRTEDRNSRYDEINRVKLHIRVPLCHRPDRSVKSALRTVAIVSPSAARFK